MKTTPVYLDCNATTPLDPRVRAAMQPFWEEECGNEGSRTHEYGARARQAVQGARDQVAEVVGCRREEIVFTSGATEANNLAILGLEPAGRAAGRRHVISSQIEHKAVLEPLAELGRRGFEIELLAPEPGGWVHPDRLRAALRAETWLVSLMAANNETGVIQPIEEYAQALSSHSAYFHVDAAQTFGKLNEPLRLPRIDLLSVSAHKVFGPKGVGALVTRRRGFTRPPLRPILFGGGQERGLRAGTLPVPLVVGFGLAAQLANDEAEERAARCRAFRRELLGALEPLAPEVHGDETRVLPHVWNASFPGLDSEAAMVALKELIAVSNGSACTSASYTPSHVLRAMNVSEAAIGGALRFSWSHETASVDWEAIVARLALLRFRSTTLAAPVANSR
ncbi:MAG: cysteine desulfurase DndA [Verrucomicrobia bacterium]|nr:cysteine desulfurase DndA [Verrucomicrobiota bacterium]